VLTELWESDPFTERRVGLIDTLDTAYRWEKGDTFVDGRGVDGRDRAHDRFRVISVEVRIGDEGLSRTILALRLDS